MSLSQKNHNMVGSNEKQLYIIAGWSNSNTYKIKKVNINETKLLPIFPGILLFTGGSKGAP